MILFEFHQCRWSYNISESSCPALSLLEFVEFASLTALPHPTVERQSKFQSAPDVTEHDSGDCINSQYE